MNDWLSKLEKKQKREELDKQNREIETEQWMKRICEEGEARDEREFDCLDENRDRIYEIYGLIGHTCARLNNVHYSPKVATEKIFPGSLKIVSGINTELTLRPEYSGFRARFYASVNNYFVDKETYISFHEISDKTILKWVKWVAKHEGRPWRKWWQLF